MDRSSQNMVTSPNKNRYIWMFITVIFLILIIIGASYYFLGFEGSRVIEILDKNIEPISNNPDLIFENVPEDTAKSYGPARYVNIYEILETFSPWISNGMYFLEGNPPGVDEEGIVGLHPFDVNNPSYLEQDIILGDNDYVLVSTIANLADYINPCNICNDNVFVMKIIDLETGKEEKLHELVINSDQGWQTVYLDISDFKNKQVRFRIEGHGGGPCADWCSEWAAVDEFYIGKLL